MFLTRFKELFAGKNLEIVFVGLENAGKSTLASKLSLEKSFDKGPTYGVDIKTFKKNNVSVKIWDLGGQGKLISTISYRMGEVCNGL